jgi:hypothetical protein
MPSFRERGNPEALEPGHWIPGSASQPRNDGFWPSTEAGFHAVNDLNCFLADYEVSARDTPPENDSASK